MTERKRFTLHDLNQAILRGPHVIWLDPADYDYVKTEVQAAHLFRHREFEGEHFISGLFVIARKEAPR